MGQVEVMVGVIADPESELVFSFGTLSVISAAIITSAACRSMGAEQS